MSVDKETMWDIAQEAKPDMSRAQFDESWKSYVKLLKYKGFYIVPKVAPESGSVTS
jgi:hypothetical protein